MKGPSASAFPALLSLARRRLLQIAGAAALVPFARRAVAAEAAPATPASPIWTSWFDQKTVWAYVDRHSVLPEESFDLMASTAPGTGSVKGRIEFFKVGQEPDWDKNPAWVSAPVEIGEQPVSRTAAATGPNWTPTIPDLPTHGWRPGVYSADFVLDGSGDRDPQIVQLVVRNPKRSGAVLFKLGTNTYQAYNDWGGHSFYPPGDGPGQTTEDEDKRGTIVSFDRPCGPSFFEYDVFIARFLEALGQKHGFILDYATDFDAHADPHLVRSYPLVTTSAHDEYWSKEIFDAFEQRLHQRKGHTIFFGANSAYWQARYSDINQPPGGDYRGRQLICSKSTRDPIVRRTTKEQAQLLMTALFREQSRRPETMLAGVAYQNYFSPAGDIRCAYNVASVDQPFFEGTGWKVGDVVGDVVGYEWDNRDPCGDGHRLWQPDSRIAAIPADQIHVLFTGTPRSIDDQQGLAEAVFFHSDAGAKVFASGSIRWSWGLGKPEFTNAAFQRFNENLVLDFLSASV